MTSCEAALPIGLSPYRDQDYASSESSTTAVDSVQPLLGHKRRRDELEKISNGNTTARRLRKRIQISYVEPLESDIESDLDSGYNSDSSVEWESRHTSKKPKTKRPGKEKPVEPFPFLSLPTELRNTIYLFALSEPHNMVLDEGWRAHRRVPKRDQQIRNHHTLPDQSCQCSLSPVLLAVNKQIYAEAAPILYSQPLHFANMTALHSFLAPLSTRTASLIHDLTLHSYETWGRGIRKAMNVSALTLLRNCSNLQRVRIQRHESYYSSYGKTPAETGNRAGVLLARQIYRDAAFWLESIGADRALRLLDMSGLCGDVVRPHWWDQRMYDDQVGLKKHTREAFLNELRHLIDRMGVATKRAGKRSRKSG